MSEHMDSAPQSTQGESESTATQAQTAETISTGTQRTPAETAPDSSASVELQAQNWREKFSGRLVTACQMWVEGERTRIKLGGATGTAQKAERRAAAAEANKKYLEGRIKSIQVELTGDKVRVNQLRLQAERRDQNPVSQWLSNRRYQNALRDVQSKKNRMGALEGKRVRAAEKHANLAEQANTAEQRRHDIAEGFAARFGKELEPLDERLDKLTERRDQLSSSIEKGISKRDMLSSRLAAIQAQLAQLDPDDPDHRKLLQKYDKNSDRIANHLARIEQTLSSQRQSLERCDTHLKRVGWAHRRLSGSVNAIRQSLVHNQTQVPDPERITTGPASTRRGPLQIRPSTTASTPRTGSAEAPQTTEPLAPEINFTEELLSIADGIRKTPQQFLADWNREYRNSGIRNLPELAERAGCTLESDYMTTKCSLRDFLELLSQIADNDSGFTDSIRAQADELGLEEDEQALTEDFILSQM